MSKWHALSNLLAQDTLNEEKTIEPSELGPESQLSEGE